MIDYQCFRVSLTLAHGCFVSQVQRQLTSEAHTDYFKWVETATLLSLVPLAPTARDRHFTKKNRSPKHKNSYITAEATVAPKVSRSRPPSYLRDHGRNLALY